MDLARSVLVDVVRASASKDDRQRRLSHLRDAYGNLEAFEALLSCLMVGDYAPVLDGKSGLAFLEWGDLLRKERNLLRKTIEANSV